MSINFRCFELHWTVSVGQTKLAQEIICFHEMLRISGKHFKLRYPGQVALTTFEDNGS